MKYFQFMDTYLQNMQTETLDKIEERRVQWNISHTEFYETLDGWFSNFGKRDKELALKILFNLQFFSEAGFAKKMEQLWRHVERYLADTKTPRSKVVLVVPDERGDSADKHVYTALKTLEIPQSQISEIANLDKFEKSETVLVFLNDTHGTGTQFVRDFQDTVNFAKFKAIFVLGTVYSERALRRFEKEMQQVNVVSDGPTASADSLFTGREWERVKRLGHQVYPKHPVGFGDTALLVAYHFQCPNNTIPLVWADGKNNESDGSAYPWKPLFPYRPKTKAASDQDKIAEPGVPKPLGPTALLSDVLNLVGKYRNPTDKKVSKWLKNFAPNEQAMADELLNSYRPWDVARTRHAIRDLKSRLLSDISRHGSDIENLVLVTTGSEQKSTYHYVFEFIREWRLNADQVIDIKDLNENRALDKHLVFFYHTRAPGTEFFDSKIEGKSYLQLAEAARPISTLVCSFAEAPGFQAIFNRETADYSNIRRISIDNASRTVKDALGEKFEQYKVVLSRVMGDELKYQPEEHLLISYYFKCPEISSPLMWFDGEGHDGEKWAPLPPIE